jgi:PKD repeat protein
VYSWDFGDGSTLGSGVSPTHTYTTAGVRNVILTVTDNEATPASDSALALIASGTTPPVADTGGPYEGPAGVPVYFDGTDSSDPDGGKLRYAWDFGDDTKASGATPTHTYAVDGTFDVTLTVIDESSRTDTDDTIAFICEQKKGKSKDKSKGKSKDKSKGKSKDKSKDKSKCKGITASSAAVSAGGASALSPSIVLLLAGLCLVSNRRRYFL